SSARNPICIHPSTSRLLLSSDLVVRGGPPAGSILRRIGTPGTRCAGPPSIATTTNFILQAARFPAHEPARGHLRRPCLMSPQRPLRLRVHRQRRPLPASNLSGFSSNR
ncbi:hypothetical protein PVAP13_4KG250905, partial [Panicum virgatum]